MRQDEEAKHIFFTADLHLLHPKIVDICNRPTTINEHDEWLIDRINSVVGKKDELYILGDVSMASKEKTDKLLQKIHGDKKLIIGNHDNNIVHSTYFKSVSQIYNFKFDSESYPNMRIILCHYPIASWEEKVLGTAHLYGHVHGRYENRGLSFDIGVDANNYYPLNLEQVYDKFTKIMVNLA